MTRYIKNMAGEALRPIDAATRKFAAHTLNLCLGYVLEEEAYTFSESGTVDYLEDIQVAINQGWLALSNGNFLPEVGKPSVTKVKSFKAKAGKKKLTLSWKKSSGVSGYQIQFGTKKNFKGAKTKNVSGTKKKYIIKSLKAKKKYYIRIRAYKKYTDENGSLQNVYGSWTKINKKTK